MASKFKPQYRRLLYIDEKLKQARRQWLREKDLQVELLDPGIRFPNCVSLAEELEVCPKTIQRDLAFLRDEQGAPVDYDSLRRGYYYTEDNFDLRAVKISESELFAIFIAERALEQYQGTPLHDRLNQVFDKIAAALPDRVSLPAPWIESRISFRQPPPRQLRPRIWETVAKALGQLRTLLITYQTPGKKPQPRQVDPYHLMNHRGDWYLVARCHRAGEVRVFAMSRISQAELQRTRFEIPAGFDPQQAFASSFGIFQGLETFEVRIRFTPMGAPYARERVWVPGQTLAENRDGSVDLSFPVNDLREVASWVLSWGPEAKALSPPELVDRVSDQLRQAAVQYD